MAEGKENVTRHMIITNQLHKRTLEKNLENVGIHRAQHRVLMTLSRKVFHSQAELAKELEITPATIAVSLKALERDGLIQKTVKREDNRVNFIELTDMGKQMVEESMEFFYFVDREMYRDFTSEELQTLCNYMDRIYHNLRRINEEE